MENQFAQFNDYSIYTLLYFGIPTHNFHPETITNAIDTYYSKDQSFDGYIIFAEWTMEENEWEVYDRYNLA